MQWKLIQYAFNDDTWLSTRTCDPYHDWSTRLHSWVPICAAERKWACERMMNGAGAGKSATGRDAAEAARAKGHDAAEAARAGYTTEQKGCLKDIWSVVLRSSGPQDMASTGVRELPNAPPLGCRGSGSSSGMKDVFARSTMLYYVLSVMQGKCPLRSARTAPFERGISCGEGVRGRQTWLESDAGAESDRAGRLRWFWSTAKARALSLSACSTKWMSSLLQCREQESEFGLEVGMGRVVLMVGDSTSRLPSF
ncbi:hypothetical protein C8R44DRAFT_741964 [Mycena epipterygia]|nr:hypothetical protein C8R44DRAFT_741964 [Mycena epipterygia]